MRYRVLLPLILALLALAACGGTPAEQVDTTAPVPVTLEAARRGAIHRVVQATGLVKPATGAELVVTAPQSARIAEMPKGVGERVRRGDLLVRFDIPALAADAATRRAEVARGESRLTLARANFERLQGLFQRGIAAKKEVEDARRELSDSEASLAEAKSARSAASDLATRAMVRAPFDGVVAERAHNPGDLVEPGPDAILRLLDPARLQVEAPVPLDQLAGVAVGNPAQVRGPGGALFPAKVIARPVAVDPATTSASVRLAFTGGTNLPALPAGTPVQVEIAGEEHRDAVLVPATAVVQEGPQTFVYTVDDKNHAHRTEVRLGITTGPATEVLSGLAAGARVVVQGQNGLPDDAVVTPAAAPAAGAAGAGAEQP
ncbi:MAG: rane fusion protein multidrug efflux system [Acidobacteriota bacterium]|jgi:RND family efflux transporter MFP subunit|nr:rane fusion protein multidrug efflux system [Acidobacteriota bacterium]